MKCQNLFSGKIRKKYFNMSSVEFFYPECYALILIWGKMNTVSGCQELIKQKQNLMTFYCH